MADRERTFTDAELDRAVEALSEPDRFRIAEERVMRAAPQLQGVLDQALAAGGWLGQAEAQQVRLAAGHEDPADRMAAISALVTEEARIGMLVGVAVGWELARELELDPVGEGTAETDAAGEGTAETDPEQEGEE